MRSGLPPILPGATIGLMGGGQLGRMTALAARALGYRVHVLDPDPDCSARGVCDRFIAASFDDAQAAAQLAASCQVVTCEREDIDPRALAAIESITLLRPGRSVIEIVQDRGVQKRWLESEGFPVGPFRVLEGAEDLPTVVCALDGELRLKARRGGFDGRSQWRIAGAPSEALLEQLAGKPLIAEQGLRLAAELSVMVARSPLGECVAFPAAGNQHEDGVLATSVMPATLEPALLEQATHLAIRIAERLSIVGLLGVELFYTEDGELLVNELAPRPHNTFHATELACATSQFEQLVRAICGLPLGDVTVVRPTAIANLFGDLWLEGRADQLVQLLGTQGVSLRLYGKAPRKNRKLGHLAFSASTSGAALAGVRRAFVQLTAKPPRLHHDIH